jgi:hypothetical protein
MCLDFVYRCLRKWRRTGRKEVRLERRDAFRKGFRTARRIFAAVDDTDGGETMDL